MLHLCSLLYHVELNMALLYGVRYREHSVVARVDPSMTTSILSTFFAFQHRMPMRVFGNSGVASCVVSGPVDVPTASGRFLATNPIILGTTPGVDLILGQDWVNSYNVDPTLSRHWQ